MPTEILKAKHGFYIPMDGPWQSFEDDMAFKVAERKYEELKSQHDYVALIQSHHQYTHGYWIETEQKEVKYPDHILKEHRK